MSALDDLRNGSFVPFAERETLLLSLVHDYERFLVYVRQTRAFIEDRIANGMPERRAEWQEQLAIARHDEDVLIESTQHLRRTLERSGNGPNNPM